jgi:hypothetical protein
VPVLSAFFGILIKMFHDDHNPPHFHVEYGEFHAIVEIRSGNMLAGRLPKRAMQLVDEWRRRNAHELRRAWDDARAGRQPRRIRPLQ